MPAKLRQVEQAVSGPPSSDLTPRDTASYTKEMLESLRAMALRQDHLVLAGLLEAAAREARRLVANSF